MTVDGQPGNAFVIANTWHGTMIVNRFDYSTNQYGTFGVGHHLLSSGQFDKSEVLMVLNILHNRIQMLGRKVVAFDLGANLGCHCVKWGIELGDQLEITAVEAQQQVYYQLCGNIVINNLTGIEAIHAAVGGEKGEIEYKEPDYRKPGSFGSLEMGLGNHLEDIGQPLSNRPTRRVPVVTMDSLSDNPPDFIKLDVEGMEEEVLSSSIDFLREHMPIILCEHIKSDPKMLTRLLQGIGYKLASNEMNILAMPEGDPMWEKVSISTK